MTDADRKERRRKPVMERFMEKVDVTDSCWLWTAQLSKDGYGRFGVRVTSQRYMPTNAHRVAYELFVGPIPEGMHLDHLCGVRNCVRPDHLEPVTPLVNVLRSEPPNRTHCPQGHEYTPENTRRVNGKRHCRACGYADLKRRRAAKRAEGRRVG